MPVEVNGKATVPGLEVIVPFRAGSSRWRERARDAVAAHYTRAGFEVRLLDADPWAPGRARNLGAAASTRDVLVFADADTLCPPMQLLEAADLAAAEPGLVFGYDLYLRLTEASTERYLAADAGSGIVLGAGVGAVQHDLYALPTSAPIFGSASFGAAAISAECFEELGGFDSAYRGWGYEDLDFVARATERFGRCRRVTGPAWHLWHGGRRDDDSPEDAFPSEVAANHARYFAATVPR